jgi:ATP-dependent Clp protease adaptor protein ClpS
MGTVGWLMFFLDYDRFMNEIAPEIFEDQATDQEEREAPLYRVIVHNDPVTTMDFVLYILQSVFMLAGPRAVQVMYAAHFHGSAHVVTLPKTEAQRRIHRAHFSARMAGYPLLFTMERD